MSIDEALKYFKNNDENAELSYWREERFTTPTAYAIAQGIPEDNYSEEYKIYAGGCWWWLRSPGYDYSCTTIVMNYGGVFIFGHGIISCKAVRPALWIKPNA